MILIIVKGKLRVAGVKLRLAGKRHRGILLSVQSSECLEFRVFIDYVTNCENLPSQESIVHQTYDLKNVNALSLRRLLTVHNNKSITKNGGRPCVNGSSA